MILVAREPRELSDARALLAEFEAEMHKPEGNSMVSFGNALSRLAELGHVTVQKRGRGGRERWVDRGPTFDRLPELLRHFGT